MSNPLRRLSLATFVAFRIVRSRRSPTLSVVTMISIVGIAVGVFALTTVLSVTAGFEGAFQQRILGVYPHLLVLKRSSRFTEYEALLETIRKVPGVEGATAVTADEMMVAHGVFRAGATIEGVDVATIESVIPVASLFVDGSLDALAEDPSVTRQGDTLRVEGAVEGTWTTVVVRDGAEPLIIREIRATPDPDHARVNILDLRGSGPRDSGDMGDKDARGPRSPVTLSPRGGDATERFNLRDPIVLPAPRSGEPMGPAVEIPKGDWELNPSGDRLIIEEGTLITLLLFDGPTPDDPTESLVLVATPQLGTPQHEANIRLVDRRGAGPELRLIAARPGADALSDLGAVGPGQHTDYYVVHGRLPGIALGKALAERLHAEVGSDLTLVTPLRGIDNKMTGPFGMSPSSARFQVAGIFEAGFHEHDARLALVDLAAAQRFLNRGPSVASLAVRSHSLMEIEHTKSGVIRAIDPYPLEELLTATADLDRRLGELVADGGDMNSIFGGFKPPDTFAATLGNVGQAVNLLRFSSSDRVSRGRYQVLDWKQKNMNLFNALKLQKVVLTMFFLIIIVVGSFVVVGSQIMVVHEKTPDIAILKAMGATRGLVRLVFTLQGLFVALVGAASGLLLGLGAVALIEAVDYQLEASIYLIDHLPVELDPIELLFIVLGTLATTLITTQISAGRAASKDPVEGLRAID